MQYEAGGYNPTLVYMSLGCTDTQPDTAPCVRVAGTEFVRVVS